MKVISLPKSKRKSAILQCSKIPYSFCEAGRVMLSSVHPLNWKNMMEEAASGFYSSTAIDPETGEADVILMDIGCMILDQARKIGAKIGRAFKPHDYEGYRTMIGSTPSEAECVNDDFPPETGISLKAIYQELRTGRDPRVTLLT
jgi:hypothetical protein